MQRETTRHRDTYEYSSYDGGLDSEIGGGNFKKYMNARDIGEVVSVGICESWDEVSKNGNVANDNFIFHIIKWILVFLEIENTEEIM